MAVGPGPECWTSQPVLEAANPFFIYRAGRVDSWYTLATSRARLSWVLLKLLPDGDLAHREPGRFIAASSLSMIRSTGGRQMLPQPCQRLRPFDQLGFEPLGLRGHDPQRASAAPHAERTSSTRRWSSAVGCVRASPRTRRSSPPSGLGQASPTPCRACQNSANRARACRFARRAAHPRVAPPRCAQPSLRPPSGSRPAPAGPRPPRPATPPRWPPPARRGRDAGPRAALPLQPPHQPPHPVAGGPGPHCCPRSCSCSSWSRLSLIALFWSPSPVVLVVLLPWLRIGAVAGTVADTRTRDRPSAPG